VWIRFFRDLSDRLIQFWRERVRARLLPLLSLTWIVGLAIAAFASWVFAEIAEEVLEKETRALDMAVLQIFESIRTPALDRLFAIVTAGGDPLALIILSVAFVVGFIRRRRWGEAATMAIAALGALGLNFWLKELFGRARPELWERVVEVRHYSFPSGHAMMSMVVYGFIGYWLAARFRPYQGWLLALATLIVVAIGTSRLYLGVHWPTDVAAGFAAGLVWLVSCILSLEIGKKIATLQKKDEVGRMKDEY